MTIQIINEDPRGQTERLLGRVVLQALAAQQAQLQGSEAAPAEAPPEAAPAQVGHVRKTPHEQAVQQMVNRTVLHRARDVRDPADYLRTLSTDPDLRDAAQAAVLPVLMAADAYYGRDDPVGSITRERIIDAMTNLQGVSLRPARKNPRLVLDTSTYPWWYPDAKGLTR
jgi:hypothetical protein